MADNGDKKASAAAAEAEAQAVAEMTPAQLQAQAEARLKELQEGGQARAGQHVLKPLSGKAVNARTTEEANAAAAKPIKVATSNAQTEVEGEMSAQEKIKMQAMLGAAKSKDTKVFSNLQDRELTVASGELDPRATVVIARCTDCSFVLESMCTKLFLQDCTNVKLVCKGKIVTQTVEMYKCHNITADFHVKIGTLQLDMSKKLKLTYAKEALFGNIIWAGAWDIELSMADTGAAHATGYDKMKEKFADANEERTQFKLSMVENKLLNEKIVRTDNGFPTTKREKDAFEARQEMNLKALAQSMGVVLPNKKREEPKVGRNDPCTCGSGRKFKKCCGAGSA